MQTRVSAGRGLYLKPRLCKRATENRLVSEPSPAHRCARAWLRIDDFAVAGSSRRIVAVPEVLSRPCVPRGAHLASWALRGSRNLALSPRGDGRTGRDTRMSLRRGAGTPVHEGLAAVVKGGGGLRARLGGPPTGFVARLSSVFLAPTAFTPHS